MPYKYQTEKLKIPRELDRRVKLSENDKLQIKKQYAGGVSIHSIAGYFEVNKRLIQFVLFPERLAHHRELSRIRRMDGRYKPTREAWASTIREHRRYKQSIYNKLTKQQ